MDPSTAASFASSAGDIGGSILSYLGNSSSIQQDQTNAKWELAQQQAEFNKDFDWNTQWAQSQSNLEQYDLANSMQIRSADAIKAGINPMVALGAAGIGYQAPAVSLPADNVPSAPAGGSALTGLGSDVSKMGQNLSRSIAAAATPNQRKAEILSLKNQQLQNDLLDTQVANAKLELVNKTGPSLRLSGSGDGSYYASDPAAHGLISEVGDFLMNKLIPGVLPGYGLPDKLQGKERFWNKYYDPDRVPFKNVDWDFTNAGRDPSVQ